MAASGCRSRYERDGESRFRLPEISHLRRSPQSTFPAVGLEFGLRACRRPRSPAPKAPRSSRMSTTGAALLESIDLLHAPPWVRTIVLDGFGPPTFDRLWHPVPMNCVNRYSPIEAHRARFRPWHSLSLLMRLSPRARSQTTDPAWLTPAVRRWRRLMSPAALAKDSRPCRMGPLCRMCVGLEAASVPTSSDSGKSSPRSMASVSGEAWPVFAPPFAGGPHDAAFAKTCAMRLRQSAP